MLQDRDERNLSRVGNYKITGNLLGKGHFGRVEEAIHTILNVKVAIKVINVTKLNDKYVKKNLKREAMIMSKLLHPNVVFLYETLSTEHFYFLVTELGSGGDLCTFIKSQRYGKLDERKTHHLAKQLTSAIAHMHENGIVHRDIKMENILLDISKRKIKIIDFGLSNLYKFDKLLKTHCGSPEYAAPELYINGRRYGPEVDIWSLGVVFYGMFFGKLPFQPLQKSEVPPEQRRHQLMEQTCRGLVAKHFKALMICSQSFRNLLQKMLNTEPNQRITIHGVLDHTWLAGIPVQEYGSISSEWQHNIISKISTALNVPFPETYSQVLKFPFGPTGGIYNIEKLHHLKSKLYQNSMLEINVLGKDLKNEKHIPQNMKYNRRSLENGVFDDTSIGDGLQHRRPSIMNAQSVSGGCLTATTNFPLGTGTRMGLGLVQQPNQLLRGCRKEYPTIAQKRLTPSRHEATPVKQISSAMNNHQASGGYSKSVKEHARKHEDHPHSMPSEIYGHKRQNQPMTPSRNCRSQAQKAMSASVKAPTKNNSSSENCSNKQTARTRFIRHICSPNCKRQNHVRHSQSEAEPQKLQPTPQHHQQRYAYHLDSSKGKFELQTSVRKSNQKLSTGSGMNKLRLPDRSHKDYIDRVSKNIRDQAQTSHLLDRSKTSTIDKRKVDAKKYTKLLSTEMYSSRSVIANLEPVPLVSRQSSIRSVYMGGHLSTKGSSSLARKTPIRGDSGGKRNLLAKDAPIRGSLMMSRRQSPTSSVSPKPQRPIIPPGVPRHTAQRAFIRKELANRLSGGGAGMPGCTDNAGCRTSGYTGGTSVAAGSSGGSRNRYTRSKP